MRAFTTRAGWLTSGYYVAMFAVMGVHLPFWPVWLAGRGIEPAEIAEWMAIALVIRIPAGFVLPVFAEWANARRMTLAAIGVSAAIVFWAHDQVETREALFLLTLLSTVLLAGMLPLGEALGNAAAREERFEYAQARGVGSFGFLAANLAGGSVFLFYGIESALWWMVVGCLLTVPLAMRHPGGGKVKDQAGIRLSDILRLSGNRAFLLAAISAGFLLASHGVIYALGSLHWRALGHNEALIGAFWAFGVAVEVVLMIGAGQWLINRMGVAGVLAISGAAGLVRWVVMCFDPPVWAIWPLQGAHALSFAAGHLAIMAFIRMAVPPGLGATAQAVAAAMIGGILMALCTWAAGLAYPSLGGTTYAIAALMSGLGLVFALLLVASWDGKRLTL